jgi:hypothetical protein
VLSPLAQRFFPIFVRHTHHAYHPEVHNAHSGVKKPVTVVGAT